MANQPPINQAKRLSGLDPLAYLGVDPVSPTQFVTNNQRDPNQNDWQNYTIGAEWLNTTNPLNQKVWKLVSLQGNQAKWIMFGGGSGSVITLTGDTGAAVGATAGNINVKSNQAALNAGSTVQFSGNPATSTLTFNTSDALDNTIIGAGSGILSLTGSNNTSVGALSCTALTTANNNCVFGEGSATGLLTGTSNIIIGRAAGTAFTGAESSNTLIGHQGFVGENNFIGVAIGSSGTLFAHNYGTINTFIGAFAGNTTLTVGTANANVGIGSNALQGLTTGVHNVAIGSNALQSSTTAAANIGIGASSLIAATTGAPNIAIGGNALYQLITGAYNFAMGTGAGGAYTGAESSNICVGHNTTGTTGESNVMRFGNGTGVGAGQINQSYIAGIYGITTVSGVTSAVLVSNGNQLGTISSSKRFKRDIEDMSHQSSPLLKLRPVTFQYNAHKDNIKQFGLVAEEVAEIMPDIVNLDDEGKPFSVRYHDLPILLLNELQKALKRIDALEALSQS